MPHLSDIRDYGPGKASEEAGVGGALDVVVVLVQALLQLEGEGVVVVPDHIEDLLLRGGGQLLRRQPGVYPGLEMGCDGSDVDQRVGDLHGRVLVLPIGLKCFV